MTPSCPRAVVLIPTYNERENIEALVPAVLEAAPVDVWIIDDSSPDGTGALAQRMADENERVQVIHRPQKAGLGQAYLDGFQRALDAGYERILQMDADFSHPIDELSTLLQLSENSHVVLGSRWTPGGGTQNWPLRRQILSMGGSLYARLWLNIPVRDLTGGFKCFRREVLESIDLSNINSTGYCFQVEVTYRAFKRGFSIEETPIVFVEREEGTSKMSRGIVLEAILNVPRLRFTRS